MLPGKGLQQERSHDHSSSDESRICCYCGSAAAQRSRRRWRRRRGWRRRRRRGTTTTLAMAAAAAITTTVKVIVLAMCRLSSEAHVCSAHTRHWCLEFNINLREPGSSFSSVFLWRRTRRSGMLRCWRSCCSSGSASCPTPRRQSRSVSLSLSRRTSLERTRLLSRPPQRAEEQEHRPSLVAL
jgi:hypothetical protein